MKQTPIKAIFRQLTVKGRFSSLIHTHPSTDAVEEYIERGLRRLNKELNDEDAVQRIGFQLITRARLTTDVFTELRGMSSKTLSTF